MIVYATGYDAITGALSRIEIRGRDGVGLKDEWAAGPGTYLGLMVSGFPNMFTVAASGSPTVLAMVIALAEFQVNWITQCIEYLRTSEHAEIDATREAQEAWTAQISEDVEAMDAYRLAPNTYYYGANVPGKPRTFLNYVRGMNAYRRACEKAADNQYADFMIAPPRSSAVGAGSGHPSSI